MIYVQEIFIGGEEYESISQWMIDNDKVKGKIWFLEGDIPMTEEEITVFKLKFPKTRIVLRKE